MAIIFRALLAKLFLNRLDTAPCVIVVQINSKYYNMHIPIFRIILISIK